MKRYEVKDVIKMEDKMRYLYNIDSENYGEDFFLPLALLGSMGQTIATLSATGQVNGNPLIPILLGSVTALFGYGSLGHFLSAGMRSDKLHDKITKIYNIMGEDFKQKVEEERQNLENGRNR